MMFKASLWLAVLLLARVATAQTVELLGDADFQRGLLLKDREGKFQAVAWQTNAAPPIWTTAQHHSQSCFADAAFQKITTNGFVFKDAYQSLTIHPADGSADFVCGVNGAAEYGGVWRTPGAPWPHLYLEQRISNPRGHLDTNSPALAAIAKLDFAVRVKLLHDSKPTGPEYNRHLHTAHYLFFLTVQNLNRKSKGYGDYFWFGIALYDDRQPVTGLYAMQDKGTAKKKGTDKFIYDIGVKPFTDKIVGAGEWVRVAGDLLPYVIAGLQEAWRRGYLAGSRDLNDYRFGSCVVGWEVTGLNDCAIAVQGLHATATLKPTGVP